MYVYFLDLSSIIDKVYQLLAHGQWFSPGTQASSTTKTGRHDIAETLLKVALNTINQIKSITDKTFTGLYCMSNSVGVLYETAYYIELLDSLPVFGGVGVDHLFRDFFFCFYYFIVYLATMVLMFTFKFVFPELASGHHKDCFCFLVFVFVFVFAFFVVSVSLVRSTYFITLILVL